MLRQLQIDISTARKTLKALELLNQLIEESNLDKEEQAILLSYLYPRDIEQL